MKRVKQIESMFKFTGLVTTEKETYYAEIIVVKVIIVKPLDWNKRLRYFNEQSLSGCHEDGNKVVMDFLYKSSTMEIKFPEREIRRRVIRLVCEVLG